VSDIVVFPFHTMPVPMMMVAFVVESSGQTLLELLFLYCISYSLSQVDFDF
jgi:hypothetical protein